MLTEFFWIQNLLQERTLFYKADFPKLSAPILQREGENTMKLAKRFLTMLLSLSLVLSLIPSTVFAVDSEIPFTDVNTTDWFYDAVQYVHGQGMMNGTSQTTFSPANITTR